ncbi:hypothetical protein MP228_003290 [Amoeboaphelidium protococcarum]|nr:hypothetical protein MP228_003290 [Amoeboaphelidium protococcarum]
MMGQYKSSFLVILLVVALFLMIQLALVQMSSSPVQQSRSDQASQNGKFSSDKTKSPSVSQKYRDVDLKSVPDLKLSAEEIKEIDNLLTDMRFQLKRDQIYQKVLKLRKQKLQQIYSCPTGSKSVMKTKRSAKNPITIYSNGPNIWGHMHFDDDQSQRLWTDQCNVPCRFHNVAEKKKDADIIWSHWYFSGDGRDYVKPLPHQVMAALYTEPHVGVNYAEDHMRELFLNQKFGERILGQAELMLSYSVEDDDKNDIPVSYAYGSALSDIEYVNEREYEDKVIRELTDRFKLTHYPIFDKAQYFAALPREDVETPLDWRGGDVALFISNCGEIWRTKYLEVLIPMLARPPPHGFGLRVDSFGGCEPGLGRFQENDGNGWPVGEITYHGFKWQWNFTLTGDAPQRFPQYYPRKRKTGESRGGVIKREMIDHYKVFLTFENSLLHGYLSEKYYEGVGSESVAIHFGPTPDADEFLMDEAGNIKSGMVKSKLRTPQYYPHDRPNVINGWDYPEPRKMAKLIYKLSTDQKYWESYFDWRLTPSARGQRKDLDDKFLIKFNQPFINLHKNDFIRHGNASWICKICSWYHERYDHECKK